MEIRVVNQDDEELEQHSFKSEDKVAFHDAMDSFINKHRNKEENMISVVIIFSPDIKVEDFDTKEMNEITQSLIIKIRTK